MNKDRVMILMLAVVSINIVLHTVVFSGFSFSTMIAVDGTTALLILGFYRYIEPAPVKFSPPWALLFVLGGITLNTLISGGWLDLISAAQPVQKQVIEAGGVIPPSDERTFLMNVRLMLVGPVLEEVIYRMALLGGLAYFIGRAPALVMSSAIFAALHIAVYPPVMLIGMFFLGLFQGVTYLLLGLPWAIAMHIMNNSRPLMTEIFLESNFVAFLVAFFSIWGIWVFLSRTIRLRRAVFGG